VVVVARGAERCPPGELRTGEVILSTHRHPSIPPTPRAPNRRRQTLACLEAHAAPLNHRLAASRRSRRGLDVRGFARRLATGVGPFISRLSHGAWMDTGRHWARSTARGACRAGVANARRGHRRCRAVVTWRWPRLAMIAISANALVIALGLSFRPSRGSNPALRRQQRGDPASAAISLGLVGHAASGERFVRTPALLDWQWSRGSAGRGRYFLGRTRRCSTGHRRLYHSHPDRAGSDRRRRSIHSAHGGWRQGQMKRGHCTRLTIGRPDLRGGVTVFPARKSPMLPLRPASITCA